jgi:hypothetical protein
MPLSSLVFWLVLLLVLTPMSLRAGWMGCLEKPAAPVVEDGGRGTRLEEPRGLLDCRVVRDPWDGEGPL